jgi:methylated-DNA-protein-cysteine methyltransferase-like protein
MERLSKNRKAGSKPGGEDIRFDKVFERIYRLVLKIPRGRVMTYGQIARLLGGRYSPRLVGWAMHSTPKDDRNIPWHRVINAKGGISTGRVIIQEPERQRWMLEAEGVKFDEKGRCDLGAYQWSPLRRRVIVGRKRRSGHVKPTKSQARKTKRERK